MNPMALFQQNTPPAQSQAMAQLGLLLGGLGRTPNQLNPLAPSLAAPPKPPQPAGQPPILGGTPNG